MNYEDAFLLMRAASDPSKGKPIAYNTRLHVNLDGSLTMRLHDNAIIKYTPTHITLMDGGFKTATTKARLNALTPKGLKVVQKDFVWWVEIGDEAWVMHNEFTVSYNMIEKLNEVKE